MQEDNQDWVFLVSRQIFAAPVRSQWWWGLIWRCDRVGGRRLIYLFRPENQCQIWFGCRKLPDPSISMFHA